MNFYNTTAESYDKLHEQEQNEKLMLAKSIIIRHMKLTRNTKVLDVGCGSGYSSNFNCNVTGIDPSTKLIGLAKQRYNHKFRVAKAEDLPFNDDEFDLVISLSAMQNFDDADEALHEMQRVSKKMIVISFPNRIVRFNELKEKLEKAIKDYDLELIDTLHHRVDDIFILKKR